MKMVTESGYVSVYDPMSGTYRQEYRTQTVSKPVYETYQEYETRQVWKSNWVWKEHSESFIKIPDYKVYFFNLADGITVVVYEIQEPAGSSTIYRMFLIYP